MKCMRMELGEPDDSGRRRPVPIEGSEFEVEADFFIAAISQAPSFDGLEVVGNVKDWVMVDDKMKTEQDNVYAGGDVIDLALVTTAIGQGRCAAETIHNNFRGVTPPESKNPKPIVTSEKVRLDFYEDKARGVTEQMDPATRLANPDAEIAKGLTKEQFIEESKRCMSCGLCFECGECWSYCQDQAVIKPLIAGEKYKFKLEFCNGCSKCAEQCPCGYIEMHLPGSEPSYD